MTIPQQLSFEIPDQPFTEDTYGLVPAKIRTKLCNACGGEFTRDKFAWRTSGALGQNKIRDSICLGCEFKRDKLYKANPVIKGRMVNYRKEYYSSDRETQIIRMVNLRAKRLGIPGRLTVHEWREVKNLYNNCCAYCGISSLPLQIDHLWPLSLAKRGLETSEFVTNDVDNILPCCALCNLAKSDRPFIIMLGWKNGLLS